MSVGKFYGFYLECPFKRIDSNILEMIVANTIGRELLLLEKFPSLFLIIGTIVVSSNLGGKYPCDKNNVKQNR